MNGKNKQIVEQSLSEYKGLKINVKIVEGAKYYKEDISIKNNVEEGLKKINKHDNSFHVKDSNDCEYKVHIVSLEIEQKDKYEYILHLQPYTKISKLKNKCKNKYEKNIYKSNKSSKYIQNIGIIQAQKAHANDVEIVSYVTLRDFLKQNPNQFSKKELYIKTFTGEFISLRHKNLFSKFKDEISDFEKITYFERNENNELQISYNLDENIMEYNQDIIGLLDRKNARNFAKDIYNKKGIYTDKELLLILKPQAAYVKVKQVLSAENKLVWDKIKVEDMNIRSLEKEFYKQYSNKKERVKNIQLKYLSKRNKRRKLRRSEKIFINEGLLEYYKDYK